MLVLTRKPNEEVLFPATGTAVRVLGVKKGAVRLGIQAPPGVPVLRGELRDRTSESRPAEPVRAGQTGGAPGRLHGQLLARLEATGVGLGLLQLQLDAGLSDDARATLVGLRDDFRLLRLGVEGEVGGLAQSPPTPPRKPLRALLVEDDCNQRELLASFLRHSGLVVDTAGDGCDALDCLRSRGRPDVVLLDMGLPRCDGPTTVRHIRHDPALAGLKVFAVTGRGEEEFDLPHGPGGVDRWFRKPVDPAELVREVAGQVAGATCHA
jgi:carbon storage regulator CsrA